MAVRIQIRRDTSTNWSTNNPVLYPGEIGFETDTKKFKIGPAVTSPAVATAWNSITAYANVVPSDLENTLGDYIPAADLGEPDGPAKLNVDGDLLIPADSIIFEGATADAHETTLTVTNPTEDRTITIPNASGTVALAENVAALSGATFTGNISVPTAIIFEGSTTDSYETTIQVTDPTDDRTITVPNVTGTLVTTGDTGSVTNAMLAGSIANEKLSNSSITINGFGISLGGSATYGTDNIGEGTTNLYFTNERAQDAVGGSLGSGLSYNDGTGAISVDTTTIQARVADVSDTEIGYLNGVTSAIQTQIDTKLSSATASTTYAPINNPTFTGTVTLPGNPGSANEAATKSYVDNISAGLNFHAAVHAATTADLSATYDNTAKTLSASGTFPQIDGHTINETERVLVKSQSSAVQNGIYTLTDDGDPSGTWVLTRASDADNSPSGEIAYGDFTFVQNGSTNGGQGFIMTTTGTITLGTSNIVYTQFNTGQSVIAGNGLSEETPGTLSINTTITADLSTAQTFTNKTLTSPKINEDVALTATATELNYVDGVTSSIQTQLNAKQAIVSGVSDTEIGYLDGVTSAIQTQIDTKVSKNGGDTITASSASTSGIIIKGAASQTAALTQWQNSAGTLIAQISSTGRFYSGVSVTAGSASGSSTATINSVPTSAATVAILAKGFTSQTADLQQWQNSSGTVLSKVDASGNITAPSLTLSSTALATTSGGTGLSSYASGDIIYASATDTLAKLTKGTDGQILTLASGVPSWAAAPITLPTQTDNGGKYLTTDGTTASWATLVVPIETGTTTLTQNTATTVDTTALSAFTSIEYMVSLKQGSKTRTSKVIMQTDGTSVDMTEFAITETGGTMSGVVVAAATSSTNGVLQVTVTDASSSNVTVKFSKVKL